MSKPRSVSIRYDTWEKVKKHCEKEGISMASFVDKLCLDFLGANGEDVTKIFEHHELEAGKRRQK